jgi:two-component system sensor histidine kinase UhpB
MVMADVDGRIVLVNAQTERLFSYARDELLGRGVDTLVPERFRAGHHGYRAAYLRELTTRPMGVGRDLYALRKDGSEFPVEIGLNPVRTSDEVFVLAAIVDITERKRGEQELRKSREQLRHLSANIEHVREEEKKRIARELHDDLGQHLTALKLEVGRIGSRIDTNAAALTSADLRNVYGLIDQLVVSVRRLAADLRPVMLDDLGLIPAIEWFVDDFAARYRIRVVRRIGAGDVNFSRESATAVFRIVQEAMTNIARHSGATEASLDIHSDASHCIVRVEDNGRGFPDDDQHAQSSFGLLGIRERASALGGELRIRTSPGQGFALRVSLPLAAIEETE